MGAVLTMKLTTAIRRFDAQLRADGKSPLTRAVYLRDLQMFVQWARKPVDIDKITSRIVSSYLTSEAFMQTEYGEPKAVASLNRAKSALRSFFRFLSDAGYMKHNPATLVRLARAPRKPPAVLADREINVLTKTLESDRSAIAKRDHLIFSLFLGTGIRLGSLVALNVDDVEVTRETIQTRGKNGTSQVVFLNKRLRRLLRAYLHNHPAKPDGPLFLSSRGGRLGARQVQLRLCHWLEKTGITGHYTIHTLRHTFATRIYENTGDLRLTQRALGHQRITTTEIYTHVSNDRLKNAVQSLGLMDRQKAKKRCGK
jgi:integrase/recombinase XerC